jgi:tetratricopeptide (TPR) repeat protein
MLVPAILAPAVAASADLANAKRLYASASYEEALNELENVPDASWDVQIDQYRALCLLGLGRTREAEQALEHLIRARPLHSVSDDQVPPRFVSMFHEIRGRTLPSIAREWYARGKRAYESGRLDEAATQLRQLRDLLSAVDVFEESSALADVKELGDGFLKLTEEKLAAAAPRPVVETLPLPPAAVPAIVPTDQKRPFTNDDGDVVPPVDVDRRMPVWKAPISARSQGIRRGILEIVTDTSGAVESAILVRPLTPTYDRDLLNAAKLWRFQPATRAGQPVKYRWQIEIVLDPLSK